MDRTEASDPKVLAHYEGLVRTTSARYVGKVLMDYEDICQVFRIKIWKALLAWDPQNAQVKARIAKGPFTEEELRDRFVFMCVRNQGKDLVKRRKPERDPLFIEDFAHEKMSRGGMYDAREGTGRDRFDSRYLCADEEEVFGEIEGEDIILPSSLSHDERRVLVCMYLGYSQPETVLRLGLAAKNVAAAVKSIRQKLQDLRVAEKDDIELAQVA